MAGNAASSARVMAARTRSGSISGTGGREVSAVWRRFDWGLRGGDHVGEQAAGHLRFLHQRIDGADDFRSLERLLENGVAAGAPGFVLIERLEQPGGKNHAHVLEARFVLHVAAKIEPGFAGKENVRENQVRDRRRPGATWRRCRR